MLCKLIIVLINSLFVTNDTKKKKHFKHDKQKTSMAEKNAILLAMSAQAARMNY